VRTVNFRDQVMYPIAYKMGIDPTVNLQTDQAAAYASFVNIWVRRLLNFDWPDYVNLDARTPGGTSGHVVAFDQPNFPVIGRVLKVYLQDPTTSRGITDTPFRLYSQGIFCGFEHGTQVWIKYIPLPPVYTWAPYDTTITYGLGALVYDSTAAPAGGNCYASAQAGNLNNPLSNASWWTLVPFAWELSGLVVRGAYAEALREDGQTDKARAEEAAVMSDVLLKISGIVSDPYDAISDESRRAPRYRTPSGILDLAITQILAAGAGGGGGGGRGQ